VHASEIGFDYRSGTMIGFGGSGPAHALRIARKLRIPRVVLPVASGVMSALGMLVSPLSFQLARSSLALLADLNVEEFRRGFERLEAEASSFLLDAGVARQDLRVVRRLDLRYFGQGYEIEVTLPASSSMQDAFANLPMIFAEQYAAVFSLSYLNEPVEIVNWKVEVWGPTPKTQDYRLTGIAASSSARKGVRQAYFPEAGGYVECPVYDRYSLAVGEPITGPAIIEERESTCVVGVGDRVSLDDRGNLSARINLDGSKA
jgi:N-methylhydantoinase A